MTRRSACVFSYAQQLMSDEGSLNNSVPLRLTWLKQKREGAVLLPEPEKLLR